MTWTRFVITSLVASVAWLGSPSSAAAADACFDEKAKQALACTGATPKEVEPRRTGASFHAVQPGAKAPVAPKPPPEPEKEGPRDDRKIRLEARDKALLLVQVQQIETLLGGTRKNAPDRLQIARRLGDTYVELESAAFRDKTLAEIKRDKLRSANAAAAGQQQTNANEADRVMKSARRRAIEVYSLIAADYPTHAQVDEVLYYLAYEYEQAGDMKNARTTYYDLIKKAPQSKYVPNAYLAFGELFFSEAQGDPTKWDLAAQAYAEVAKYPPPSNKVYGYALYKLAYVHWNKSELDKALDAFKKTIDFGVAYASLLGASKLADNARRDVIPVYALKGDPAKAYPFLHNLSGDPIGSNEKTYKMMDELGNAYLDTGHYPEGIVVYKDLISRDKGGNVCGYQARITEAVMAMKSADKELIRSELDSQLRVMSAFQTSGRDEKQKRACANRTAALVTETAMAWHLEAVGSQGQRGTNDPTTMKLAARVYDRAVTTWTKKDFESFEFPRLIKEDWPTSFKLKYAMADLLYSQQDWPKCGPAFDAVFAEDPSGSDAPKAAYAAALCYQKVYEDAHKGDVARRGGGNLTGRATPGRETAAEERARLEPKTMTVEQIAMVRAFDRYICNVKPKADDAVGQAQMVEVEYARARTYFEAQHWDIAALAFRGIAVRYAEHASAVYAAQLALESQNVLYKHFAKASCAQDMTNDVARYTELYCTGDKAARNAAECQTLRVVSVDLMRLEAERLVKKADAEGGKDAIEDYDRGGQAFFELFRKYCQDPVAAGQKPQAERCDEIAYNAARAFQAARLLAKAITARRALLAFDDKTQLHSPLARRATYEIGANYQAIAVYDLAADWYEKYARNDARGENADRALADAVLLRLGLGQEPEALRDAQDFTKSYGAAKPAQTAAIAFAIGAHHAEKEDWEKARVALTASMAVIERAAPDVQVQAHATLGRALEHLKQRDRARPEFAKARALWSDPPAAEAKIKAAYPEEDEVQRERRVRRAVTAVGEAFFFAAEDHRLAEVEPLKFPEYRGPGDKASVKAHIDTKVKEWYLKKMAAIKKVEPDYEKILDLKPVPPPKWVIAAGSRAGLLWGDFVDDFRRSPYPAAWKGTALEREYLAALDAASEPYKVEHARPALKKCLDLATKHQYFDGFSRGCEVWLAKNYKSDYHVVDELRGAPTLVNSGLDERAPPVLTSGAFWHPPAERPEKAPEAPAKPSAKTPPNARRM